MENNASSQRRELALQLLTAAVTAAGKQGKTRVAARLGYGRALLSRVLSPNDPLQISDKLAARVIDRFHVIPACPATSDEQPRSECLRISSGAAPMHNPMAMRIWKVCQSCPHKPEGERK